MEGHRDRGVATGLALGVIVAFSAALLISVLAESVFLETGSRVVVFVIGALAAPPTVLLARWVGRLRGEDGQTVLAWALAGSLAFDGLAIGFWSGLYGQTGDALASAAAALLWAFACVVAAGEIMKGRGPLA